MCKIMIVIEGGVIQNIYMDRRFDLVIIDRDNFDGENNKGLVQEFVPEVLPGGEKFSTQLGKSEDEIDMIVYDKLKELGY